MDPPITTADSDFLDELFDIPLLEKAHPVPGSSFIGSNHLSQADDDADSFLAFLDQPSQTPSTRNIFEIKPAIESDADISGSKILESFPPPNLPDGFPDKQDIQQTEEISRPSDDLPPPSLPDSELSSSSLDQGVFKRPLSPILPLPETSSDTPMTDLSDGPGTASSVISARIRKDLRIHPRLEPHPLQRCFLSLQKKKKPETDPGHMVSILRTLQNSSKLLIPDSVLTDYFGEAGISVNDGKVARLLGAAAEHHSASIIQDVLQIYVDGQQDRKRQSGRDRDSGAPKSEKVHHKSKAPKSSRPTTNGPEAPKTSSKRSGTGKKRKRGADGEYVPESQLPHRSSLDKEISNPGDDSVPLADGAVSEAASAAHDAMDVDEDINDKSATKSIISKDEREGASGRTRKEKEKEVEKKNILTLELLAPVLREQGYQVGRPPYFVN